VWWRRFGGARFERVRGGEARSDRRLASGLLPGAVAVLSESVLYNSAFRLAACADMRRLPRPLQAACWCFSA
jgi:hypothetical protein